MNDLGPEWQNALKRSLEGMQGSRIFMSLFTDNFKKDPKCLMQLGLAVMLDKPIYLVAPKGTVIPGNLIRMAEHIEFADFSDPKNIEAASKRVMAAAKKYLS